MNSKALTPKFLSDIEENYKNIYLPQMSQHAHLLMYDWTEEGEINDIVDDIEALNFEGYDREDSKMKDWDFATWDQRRAARGHFANCRLQILLSGIIVRYDIPEVYISAEDNHTRMGVLNKVDEVISFYYILYYFVKVN